VYPVRVHGNNQVQYLRIRADEGVIGVGGHVSVWRQNEWRCITIRSTAGSYTVNEEEALMRLLVALATLAARRARVAA
jgi:hypothetical protein